MSKSGNPFAGDMGTISSQFESADSYFHLLDFLAEACTNSHAKDLKDLSAAEFLEFCLQRLSEDRPVQTFSADGNVGIIFQSGERVILSPPIGGQKDNSGEMAKTPLSAAQRAGIPDVFADQGAIPVSGAKRSPKVGQNYSQYDQKSYRNSGGKGEDRRLSKPTRDLRKDTGGNL